MAFDTLPTATPSVFDTHESNVQSYARSFTNLFDRAKGAEVWDTEGRRYLDFLAGAGSLNYGHNNPVMKRALIEHIERDAITHSLDLHTVAKQQFLETFRDVILAPRGLDYVLQFTGPTGTNAVEAALKLARKVTGRTNVISFTNGFHGVSLGALAVTGNQHFRKAAGAPLPAATVAPYDGYFGPETDTIEQLAKMLDDPSSGVDAPAAVIVEAIQGEGGLNAASASWLRRLSEVCKASGALLILDDIQAGNGRSGDFFSFEAAGIKPDIVTLSKSLSGYGTPFSVVLVKREHDQWAPGEHNGTFRGNNHAFVTAAAALEHYWSTPYFSAEVKAKAAMVRARLAGMVDRFEPHMTQVRGRGMMSGVVCADPAKAASITADCYQNGLIIERSGAHDEVIKILAPLTATASELEEGLHILECAAARVFNAA